MRSGTLPPSLIEEAEFYVDEGKLYLRLTGDLRCSLIEYMLGEGQSAVFRIDGNQADPMMASYLKVSSVYPNV